jgi:hypothetical protein
MNKTKKLLILMPLVALASVILSIFPESFANSQGIFQRLRMRRQPVSSCPGGVCPTDIAYQTVTPRYSRAHWTYPGTIAGHLQREHRVSTTGMSREQMLNLHDALHEGTVSVPTRTASLPVKTVKVVNQTVYTPPTVVETSDDFDFVVETSEKGFRRSLLKAISDARKAKTITPREALRLRVASFSPAFLEQAEELCIVQMAMSEEGQDYLKMSADGTIDKTAIDWEGLAGFLERIIPILLQLFKAFGL